jgi:photosystem II stability/assembly factor-like uncharacterized protein
MIKTIRGILSFLILISLAYPSSAQTQPWKKLQSPVNITLRYLSFVDSLTGWAAGEAGTIIRTTDGGNSWEVQNSTVQTFIMDIFFVDENLGWALTLKDAFPFNSVILKTTNGGDEWTAENFPDSSKLIRTIFFFDSLNGFVGGSYIAQTSDGGNSWVEADIDSNMVSGFPVYKFNFLNRQFGYACGGRIDVAGVVWRTTDYGLNWSAQGISADEVFDIFVFDSLNAMTLSGDPEGLYPIADLKTTNAGINWIYEELPFFGLSFRIDFRTYNEGWSASGYKFLLTTNRGETWEEFETPDSAVVYDVQFLDARIGYAVGENGVILKYISPPDTNVFIPDQFFLYQNYPNPFNSKTVIGFDLSTSGNVTLKVYDVLGNMIATLVDEYKPAGSYEIEFNTSFESSFRLVRNLASGIYFYQLRIRGSEINSPLGQAEQELIQTKKMIYLK